MKINDDWEFDDAVTGLKLTVVTGKKLDRLKIENIQGDVNNRDFWFDKNGKFNGTGSATQIKGETK